MLDIQNPAGASDQELADYIRSNYPQFAPFLDIPDIATVLFDAARNQWDAARLTGAVEATGWWKTHSDTVRQWNALQATDPATAQQRIQATSQRVAALAGTAGLQLSQQDFDLIAQTQLQYGFDDAWVRQELVHFAYSRGNTAISDTGDIASAAEQIKALGRQYLQAVPQALAVEWAEQIWRGTMTQQGLASHFASQAKLNYPPMANDIDTGVTPSQWMSSTVNAAASALEISPDQVNLLDPKWSPLLSYQDKTGALRPMTQAEAGVWARGQDEWRFTKQANDQSSNMALGLAQQLGAVK